MSAPVKTARPSARSRLLGPGLLLGVGFGGFFDGIVLHQGLQWHHLLSAPDARVRTFPADTVAGLQTNTLWDGLFHVTALLFFLAGLGWLWHRLGRLGDVRLLPRRALTGLLAAGWGLFNLVEGTVDHHLLQVHHVRDDVTDPLAWDLGFLAVGLVLLLGGPALYRSTTPRVA